MATDAELRHSRSRQKLLATLRATAVGRAPDAPAIELVIEDVRRVGPMTLHGPDVHLTPAQRTTRRSAGRERLPGPIRARIETGRRYADAFHRLGLALRVLRSEAHGEILRRASHAE
jgi:hypothetical protein